MSLFKHSSDFTVLAINIESSSVEAGLIGICTDKQPKIIYSFQANFTNSPDKDKGMIKALELALEKLSANGVPLVSKAKFPKSCHHALVTLSSPWIRSTVSTYVEKREKSFLFDEHFANGKIMEKEDAFKKGLEGDYKLLESDVTRLTLNGYPVDFPTSKKTSSVEMDIFSSAVERKLLSRIEDDVRRVFGLKHGIHFQSFPLIYFKVFMSRPKNPGATDTLTLVSGDATDIMHVSLGRIKDISTSDQGYNKDIRLLAEGMGLPMEIASSYLALFAEGNLDDATSNKISKILPEDGEFEVDASQEDRISTLAIFSNSHLLRK